MDTTNQTTPIPSTDIAYDDWEPALDPAASFPSTETDVEHGMIVHHAGARWLVEDVVVNDGVVILVIRTAETHHAWAGQILYRLDSEVTVEDDDVTAHLAGKHDYPVEGCRGCEIEWETCGNCDRPIEKGSWYCSTRCADQDRIAP